MLRPIFDRALASGSKTYLVAVSEKRIAGFGSLSLKEDLWPEGRVACVDELVVDNQYRNKSIGASLLARLIATAKRKGCCRVELPSAFYRKDSHFFTSDRGFQAEHMYFRKFCERFLVKFAQIILGMLESGG